MSALDPNYPFIREIKSPVTAEQLTPLDKRCAVVQFASPLADTDHAILAKFLKCYPEVPLRIYGHYQHLVPDVGFLCYYNFLKRFHLDVWHLESLDGLEFLPASLELFGFGHTKSKRFSLRLLDRLPNLKVLYLNGHAKDFEAVGRLSLLEQFNINSITLTELSALTSLKNLRRLAICLGGTKELELLPRIGQLKGIELVMIKGLVNIEAIGHVDTLQNLALDTIKNVSKLPSFKKLTKLRRVSLIGMKGISDLSPLIEAPALEELCVGNARQLTPEHFRPLVGHPTLKRVSIGLCSIRKNNEVKEMLGLSEFTSSSYFNFNYN